MSFAFSVTARKTLLRMQRRFYNFQMCSTCFWTEHSATRGKSQIVVTWSIFLDYWHPFKGTSSRTSFRFYQGLWGLFSSSLTDCRRALFSAMTAIVKKWHNSSSACECCLHRKSEMLCQKKSHPESALDSWPSKCYLRSSPIDIQWYGLLSWFQSAKTCLVGRIDIVSESCIYRSTFLTINAKHTPEWHTQILIFNCEWAVGACPNLVAVSKS